MSVQWYYVDNANATVGPVSQKVLADAFVQGKITSDSYVWNGTTVNEWLAIRDVSGLETKLKPKPKPKPKPAAKPKAVAKPKAAASGGGRPNPLGGGAGAERNNLLASIRAGKQLKKQPKKVVQKKKPVTEMSLAEQMKLKLQARQKQGGKKNLKKKSSAGGKKYGSGGNSSGARGGANKGGGNSSGARGGANKGGARGSSGAQLPYKLKNKVGGIKEALGKLTSDDEWKILAIEKILS